MTQLVDVDADGSSPPARGAHFLTCYVTATHPGIHSLCSRTGPNRRPEGRFPDSAEPLRRILITRRPVHSDGDSQWLRMVEILGEHSPPPAPRLDAGAPSLGQRRHMMDVDLYRVSHHPCRRRANANCPRSHGIAHRHLNATVTPQHGLRVVHHRRWCQYRILLGWNSRRRRPSRAATSPWCAPRLDSGQPRLGICTHRQRQRDDHSDRHDRPNCLPAPTASPPLPETATPGPNNSAADRASHDWSEVWPPADHVRIYQRNWFPFRTADVARTFGETIVHGLRRRGARARRRQPSGGTRSEG